MWMQCDCDGVTLTPVSVSMCCVAVDNLWLDRQHNSKQESNLNSSNWCGWGFPENKVQLSVCHAWDMRYCCYFASLLTCSNWPWPWPTLFIAPSESRDCCSGYVITGHWCHCSSCSLCPGLRSTASLLLPAWTGHRPGLRTTGRHLGWLYWLVCQLGTAFLLWDCCTRIFPRQKLKTQFVTFLHARVQVPKDPMLSPLWANFYNYTDLSL